MKRSICLFLLLCLCLTACAPSPAPEDLPGENTGETTETPDPTGQESETPDPPSEENGQTQPALAPPVPVLADERTVTWDAVPGAERYVVTCNGQRQPAQTATFFRLPDADGSYAISVRAVATGRQASAAGKITATVGWVTLPQ